MSGPEPFNPGTIADTVEAAPDLRPLRPLTIPPGEVPTFGETYQAQRRIDRVDRSDFERQMLAEGYAPIVDALGLGVSQNPGGFEEVDPMARAPRLTRSELLARQGGGFMGSMTDRPTQERLIAAEIRARRQQDPGFLKGVPDNVADLRAYFIEQQKKLRSEARNVAARSEGWGGSAASLAGSLVELGTDPNNIAFTIATAPLGGGGGALRVFGTEFLLNSGLEAILLPQVAANRALLGEELTAEEAVANVAVAGLAGGTLATGLQFGAKGIGGAYDLSAEMVFKAMPDSVQRRWADRMKVGNVTIGDMVPDLDSREVAAFARNTIGADRLTPDEQGAINVIEREQEIGERSPFEPSPEGDAAHGQSMSIALQRMLDGPKPRPMTARAGFVGSAATPAPNVSRGTISGGRAAFESKVRGAESGGDDGARNARSSAAGRYQFTAATWARYHRKIYGGDGLADKYNPAKQERLMAALTDDNEDALSAFGIPLSPGNYYLAHFAGSDGAVKLHRAAPGTSAEAVLGAKVIAANPFLRGKSAGDVIDWAARKMGGKGGEATAAPRLADSADDAARLAEADVQPASRAAGDQDAIDTAPVPVLKRSLFDSDDDWIDAQVQLARTIGDRTAPQSAVDGPPGLETGARAVDQPDAGAEAARGALDTGEPIDVGTYVDAYLRGEGRGDSPRDRALLQFATNNGPAVEAEFGRRATSEYTVAATRYSKDKMLVQPVGDGSGYKTPASKLIEALGGRWTGRESGYVMSAAAVRKLDLLRAAGFNADTRIFNDQPVSLYHRDRDLKDLSVAEALNLAALDPKMRLAELDVANVRIDDPALKAFDDPLRAADPVADSLEHDYKAALLAAPARGARLIDLGDGAEPRTLLDILDEIESDRQAATALRACL